MLPKTSKSAFQECATVPQFLEKFEVTVPSIISIHFDSKNCVWQNQKIRLLGLRGKDTIFKCWSHTN